jgi:diphthine-ammonia ligase
VAEERSGAVKKAFVSWSGGKDCCLAAHRAQKQGLKISYLLNMVTQDRQRSCSHGLAAEWIRVQAKAMDVPVLQYATTSENYREVFVGALAELKKEGVSSGVFGDIDFEPHREWIKEVCASAGVLAVLPLWGGQQEKLSREFIASGFAATVVATRADLLGAEWLGRKFDLKFLKELAGSYPGVTPCGEAGEFHTLVIDGPLFRRRLVIQEALPQQRGEHWFWDIRKIDLRDKRARRRY